MEKSWIFQYIFLFSAIFLVVSFQFSNAQLAPTESRILFQVQQLLEYPPSLQSWNNWTNFCFLPPTPSLTIACSNNHITELTIVGNKSSPSQIPKLSASNFAVSKQTLSDKFSLDSFFTVLTKLSSLQKLSLVSLGLWGSLPRKINRFRSLEVLNISSNFMFGEMPQSISSYQSLRSLVLSDNLFNGSFPDLTGLSLLEELDLSNNDLGPKFPSLGNNLVRISLGNNSLRSEIPQDLKKLNRLQVFDVSSNRLVGPMPSFLFSMPSIQYINLAKNQLSGAFAPNASCNSNLTFKDALAVKPPVRNQKEDATLKLGIVLGIIGGIVVILGLLGLLILIVFRRVRRNRGSEYKCDSFVMEKNPLGGSPMRRHVPQPMRMTSLGLPPYHVFTLEEMEDATNNFDPSNLVREGSEGQLYKGWLRDGSVVLVKCLKLKQKHSSQALQQHMEVISKLRHRHLVSVLGHCIVTYQDHPNTASTVFIVLENISNGSLSDHLIDWRNREVLKWPQRMGITMGIARGIQYLHTGGILGNDLKIDNILLDESLTAKISSYNINLPSKVGTESPLNGQGTPNHPSSENPEKEDIYRLGVILIEVMTGRPINSQSELDDLKFQLERSLAESPSKLRDLIDPSMRGTFAYESLKTIVQITINCLCRDPTGRPTVEDVLWHMQYSVQVQEGWTNSRNLSGNLSGNLSNKF
ncbi:hypothetical protein DH2020_026961 [Rehmannia glutinosa]|uniref:Protein kinase domain-containing protein n=1 Tax=Rehmannia glutinosa TaxID=99300 RepID=A0ABR0VZB5_REHGL